MDIISVVLGADTKKDRTKDSIKIIEYAFKNYQILDAKYMLNQEFDRIVESTRFNVVKGITNEITLDLSENDVGFYPVDKEKIKDAKVETELETNRLAPITKNDKLRKDKDKYSR